MDRLGGKQLRTQDLDHLSRRLRCLALVRRRLGARLPDALAGPPDRRRPRPRGRSPRPSELHRVTCSSGVRRRCLPSRLRGAAPGRIAGHLGICPCGLRSEGLDRRRGHSGGPSEAARRLRATGPSRRCRHSRRAGPRRREDCRASRGVRGAGRQGERRIRSRCVQRAEGRRVGARDCSPERHLLREKRSA